MERGIRFFANRQPLFRSLTAVFALLVVVVAFQNCSQPAQIATDSVDDKMKFAYEAVVDQVSYMSCPSVMDSKNVVSDPDTYFTFKVGAYRFGGIGLNNEFYQEFRRKLPERQADLLSKSKANTRTIVQMAVRQSGALNTVVHGTGNLTPNVGFSNLLSSLGSFEVSQEITRAGFDPVNEVPTGKRVRFIPARKIREVVPATGARFEGKLQFGASEALQSTLRTNYLSPGNWLLSLTFLEPSESGGGPGGSTPDVYVRNPGTIFSNQPNTPGLAYGTGFQLGFSQPIAGAKGLQERTTTGALTGKESLPYPSNVLSQVLERDLLTGVQKDSSLWVCPDTLRYKIVRPGDETEANCTRQPDPAAPWSLEFSLLRNALPVELWYIDVARRCVIPKRALAGSCYGDLAKVAYVQYNLTDVNGCDPHSNADTNRLNSKICAAYVSVCYRKDQ